MPGSSVHLCIAFADSLLPGAPAEPDDLDPRWQAIIRIAEYIESHPEEIWAFVAKWGTHPQEDIRDAVATCLLEHLLEVHFDLIFSRVEALALTDELFANTFQKCWKFGQSLTVNNAKRIDQLTRRLNHA